MFFSRILQIPPRAETLKDQCGTLYGGGNAKSKTKQKNQNKTIKCMVGKPLFHFSRSWKLSCVLLPACIKSLKFMGSNDRFTQSKDSQTQQGAQVANYAANLIH